MTTHGTDRDTEARMAAYVSHDYGRFNDLRFCRRCRLAIALRSTYYCGHAPVATGG